MTAATTGRFVTTTVEVEGREEIAVVELPAFEPLPWGPRERLNLAGKAAERLDALAKVTGTARYTSDISLPGMLFAAALRAPIPSGRVTLLDTTAAKRLPGVQAVLTGRDIPLIPWLHGEPLLSSRVRYPGQPVAVVAAESLRQAQLAVERIKVRYRVGKHVVGLQQFPVRRLPGMPAPPFTERVERGDVRRAIKQSPAVVTQTYRVPAVLHQALEPHGSVVFWDGGRVVVYDSTQGVYRVRRELAEYLGIGEHRVRVVAEHVGGGFGSKNNCGSYTVLAALLSKATGRPVKFILDRREVCLDCGHRPETIMRVTLGAARDGVLQAIDFEAWIALGADGWVGGPGQIARQLYRCENVRTVEHYFYTNVGPMSSMRAPYHVEGAFALESAMDLLARRLRIDPLEFRRRNLPDEDQEKKRPYVSLMLGPCLEEVSKRMGWRPDRPGDTDRRRFLTGRELRVVRGRGIAAQVWPSGGGPPAYAFVRINRDGTAEVATGTQDMGTGSRTVLAQIAAEVLGLPLDRVRVTLGDTESCPYANNSWGSMTTASVGPAVRMAAEDALRQLLEAAADLLNVPADKLVARRGRIVARGTRRSVSFEKVTEHLGDIVIVGRGHRGPNPTTVTVASFGVQGAEVEVDLETGVVRVLRIVAAHDCGRAINPELAESQLHGGIIQGLGYALFERRLQDRRLGVPLNCGLHEYKVPTLADIPAIETRLISVAEPAANHVGAKGLGEPPIIPTAPAIANAVFDAIGVQVTELPLTAARVLAAIKKARRRKKGVLGVR
ncbi:MAG: acylaldehyde oxidase [Gemmatimonadales bacterium]|nr:MAG: acylaldehyde oxidase [Gemmatimonadales bacterium]